MSLLRASRSCCRIRQTRKRAGRRLRPRRLYQAPLHSHSYSYVRTGQADGSLAFESGHGREARMRSTLRPRRRGAAGLAFTSAREDTSKANEVHALGAEGVEDDVMA